MTQKFKTGDIVKLKSGGPPMTVKELGPEDRGGEYLCEWFSGSTLKSSNFAPDSLIADEVPSEVSLTDRISAARKRVRNSDTLV